MNILLIKNGEIVKSANINQKLWEKIQLIDYLDLNRLNEFKRVYGVETLLNVLSIFNYK